MLGRALLAAHPEEERALAEELDRAGLLATPANPTPRPLTFSDLPRLTHLDGVSPLLLTFALTLTLTHSDAVPCQEGCLSHTLSMLAVCCLRFPQPSRCWLLAERRCHSFFRPLP